MAPEMLVDVSYAPPQAHKIVNVALHLEYALGIIFIFFPREEGSLSCLRQTQGVTPMSVLGYTEVMLTRVNRHTH
jgi:hypothetical protein